MVSVAAEGLGIATDNLYHRINKRSMTFQAALHETRDEILDIAELALFDAVKRGEQWALVLMLKASGKSRGTLSGARSAGRKVGT